MTLSHDGAQVSGASLPLDVYKFRFEADIAPIYIYRITPAFDPKDVYEKKTCQATWDEANSRPLDKHVRGCCPLCTLTRTL